MSIDGDYLLVIAASEMGVGEPDLGAKPTEVFFKVLSVSVDSAAHSGVRYEGPDTGGGG